MLYNIHYDICACIILGIILVSVYCKKKIPFFQNKIFISMIWATLISTFFDILNVVGSSYSNSVSRQFMWLINYGYFIFRNLVPFFYACYSIILTDTFRNQKKRIKAALFIPVFIMLFLIFLNSFYPFIFYIDEQQQYYRRNGIFLLYLIAVYYLIFGIFYITVYRKGILLKERLALYSFVFLAALPMAVQVFYPSLLLESFGISICLWLIDLTIQKPEGLVDRNTGLMNQHAFLKMISTSLKEKEKFYVIFLLIEDFPFLNRTFGMKCMNHLIKEIAVYLNHYTKIGTIYHMGENRFALILRGIDLKAAKEVLFTINTKFKSSFRYKELKIRLFVRLCFLECPTDAKSPETILEIMELFIREEFHKQEKILFANQMDLNYKKHNTDIEIAIKRGMIEHKFEVYYQPIFSAEKQSIISAEALIRLKDEKLGFVSPEEFIPIAEKTGDILKIGNFVFESVCRFISESNLKERGIEFIEINLSVVQCMQDKIVEQFEEILKRYQVDVNQINLEITETAAASSSEVLEMNMKNMADKGILFALDDYGSGYSNMNYIIQLPFRLVKIDKSIVWASFENKKAAIAIESLILMIKKLNMQIVAEGVETKQQADKLIEIGCDYLQGYYYSRPVPKEQFLELL